MDSTAADIATGYAEDVTPDELRAWREQHKLTQGELGAALGVTWNAVWRWEHGQRRIPPMVPLALRQLERAGKKKAPRG